MDSVMFEAVANLFNMNADVKNGADGIKSEFYHDFIKHMCSGECAGMKYYYNNN